MKRKLLLISFFIVFIIIILYLFTQHKKYSINITYNNNINKISIFDGRSIYKIDIIDSSEIKNTIHWLNSLKVTKRISRKSKNIEVPNGPAYSIHIYSRCTNEKIDEDYFCYYKNFIKESNKDSSILVSSDYIYIIDSDIYKDLDEIYNSKSEIARRT